MSDCRNHFFLGAGFGAATYLILCRLTGQQSTLTGLLGCSTVGGVTALAPDVLEPATSPNHRKFFHSFCVLAGLTYADYRILRSLDLTSDQKVGLLAASSGYVSHLLKDAVTPKSLPAV